MPIIPAEQLPIEVYHSSAPAWLSKTSIRDYLEHGPSWFRQAYIDKTLARQTPGGAEQGQALDCYLTEGEEVFVKRYVVKPPELSLATKEGKAWKEAHAGRKVISHEDSEILADAVAAVVTHPQWAGIQCARAQTTIRRYSQGLGLGLQSRPDWLDVNRGILYDLKKTRDLSRFGAQAIDLGYHIQAAIAGWCLAGESIPLEHAYLVAVEWERGARCRVYEIPQEALAHAEQTMRQAAAEIADRIKRDYWTDNQSQIEQLPIPEYLMRKMSA